MKSGIEMVSDVARQLDTPLVQALITGRVWKFQRPANPATSDVVVNSLALTNQQLQQGVVNVNIHVPNLKNVTINGVPDTTLPDLVKMDQIEKAVVGLLDANFQYDYHTKIDEPGQPYQEGSNWYLNIRVNYYAFQNDYQNI